MLADTAQLFWSRPRSLFNTGCGLGIHTTPFPRRVSPLLPQHTGYLSSKLSGGSSNLQTSLIPAAGQGRKFTALRATVRRPLVPKISTNQSFWQASGRPDEPLAEAMLQLLVRRFCGRRSRASRCFMAICGNYVARMKAPCRYLCWPRVWLFSVLPRLS